MKITNKTNAREDLDSISCYPSNLVAHVLSIDCGGSIPMMIAKVIISKFETVYIY